MEHGRKFGRGRTVAVAVTLTLAIAAVVVAAVLIGTRGSEPESRHPLRAASGLLVVRQSVLSGSSYAHGAVSYVRVETADGVVLVDEGQRISSREEELLRTYLPSGTYELTSYQRPCEFECDVGISEIIDRCSVAVALAPGDVRTASVQLRPGLGCEVIIE
jgi:hypothetical protein